MLFPARSPLKKSNPLLTPWPDIDHSDEVTAEYQGLCPVSGELLSLPRTRALERIAREFAEGLELPESKMIGILLVTDGEGNRGTLKAFSGRLNGAYHHSGWVPPVFEFEESELERVTRARLSEIKNELIALSQQIDELDATSPVEDWEIKEALLKQRLDSKKNERRQREFDGTPRTVLDQESREDSRRKREFKAAKKDALEPWRVRREAVSLQISALRKERKRLSRQLQAEMHQSFEHHLWAQEPWSLASLFPSGPPTGTGDCCAPKLLHYANQNQLVPLALAEFWHGESTENRTRGEFYLSCKERCQPLLGPLLCRTSKRARIVFQDDWILVAEKMSGLLTVPGRHRWNQDSLLTRLSGLHGDLFPVHRLDLETSGLVIFAKSKSMQASLQQLFAQRKVQKSYRARLSCRPEIAKGIVSLPLGPAPGASGRYTVTNDGKEAVTRYEMIDDSAGLVDFFPLTGRSHQLRVHAAEGLNCPILGDPIYGKKESTESRLLLHARRLEFRHPQTSELIVLESEIPF